MLIAHGVWTSAEVLHRQAFVALVCLDGAACQTATRFTQRFVENGCKHITRAAVHVRTVVATTGRSTFVPIPSRVVVPSSVVLSPEVVDAVVLASAVPSPLVVVDDEVVSPSPSSPDVVEDPPQAVKLRKAATAQTRVLAQV